MRIHCKDTGFILNYFELIYDNTSNNTVDERLTALMIKNASANN